MASLAHQQLAQRRRAIDEITTPAQIRDRQDYIRSAFLRGVGGLPQDKAPLNPKITATLERSGYRIEKLLFESLPKFYVTANLYVPDGPGPFPAILGVAGHSDAGKAEPTYQHVWISLAKRGIAVLAYDPPGQGERLEYLDKGTGKSTVGIGTREHIAAGMQALLTGTTMARYFINDGVRALDYLLTRPDIDGKRIGVAGNSGGGTQAALLAVAEPRLAAAVTSCYITSWRDLWAAPGPQDAEQVIPGLLAAGLDFPDFLLAFAPKPIEMLTATKDFFPIAGARSTFAEADKLFRIDDAPGRAGYYEFDDKHGWSLPRREATYRWFARWLLDNDRDEGREPIHQVEPAATLNATSTGQVATSLPDAETVWSINLQLAEDQYANRRALTASPEELRSMIRSRLGVVSPPDQNAGSPRTEGNTELGVSITEPRTPVRTVLWLGGSPPVWRNTLYQSGTRVITVALRGLELAEAAKAGYTPEYQFAMRAILLGKTALGMQVSDALAAYAWAKTRYPSARFLIAGGTPHSRAVALLAAALVPEELHFIDNGPLTPWIEIARMPVYHGPVSLMVPGVLSQFDLQDVRKVVTSD